MNTSANIIKLLLLAAALAFSLAARAEDAAGIVIVTSGQVQAVQSDGTARALKRRSPFYVGEVIRVAADAKAQIRFADGTLLSLRPDTELRVDAFHYDPDSDGAQDKNFFTLLKGGFRTITGAVGKRHPEAYRANTPVATIGVRGTVYSAALDDGLYVGVWQGGVTVQNDKGKLDLGINAPFNFARIAAAGELPKGLMAPPAILMARKEPPPAQRESPENAPEQGGGEQGTTDGEPPAPVAGTGENSDSVGTLTDAGPMPGGDDTTLPPPPADSGDIRTESALAPTSDTLTSGGTTDLTLTRGDLQVQPTYTDLNSDGVPDLLTSSTTTTTATTDLRLTSTELAGLDRLGLVMAGGNPGPYPLRLGKASDGSGGAPLFVWNGLPPDDPAFATTAAVAVVRRGSATTTGLQSSGSYPVSWGTWNGTPTTPVLVQTDATDPTVTTPLPTQVFWMTAVPTAPAVIAGLSGKGVYKNVLTYRGGTSLGSLDALYTTAVVDFDTGAVQGDMYIHSSGGHWEMTYGGSVSGSGLDLTVDPTRSNLYSTVNGTQSADGTLAAVFSGSGGGALAGAFDFQTTSGPAADVDGVFLLDKTPVGDLRLTATEQAAIDRKGLAVVDDMSSVNSAAAGTLLANASDGSFGSPILVDTVLNSAGFPVHIMRQGLTTLTNLQSDPSYTRTNDSITVTLPVSWGSWNDDLADAVLDQYNPDDPLLNAAIMRPVNWITVVPTSTAVISGLSGSISYTNVVGVVGTSSGGALTSPSASALVDFTTGSVSGNMNFSNAAADLWSTSFSGTLNGAALNITSVSGNVNGGTAISGQVDGYLTGPKAEGMAGVFDYEAVGNPAVHAEGTFLLGCGTLCP